MKDRKITPERQFTKMHFCLDWHLSENEKNPIDFFNGLPRAPIPQWTLDFLVPNGNQALKEFFAYICSPFAQWKKIGPTIYDSNATVFLALFILSSPHF